MNKRRFNKMKGFFVLIMIVSVSLAVLFSVYSVSLNLQCRANFCTLATEYLLYSEKKIQFNRSDIEAIRLEKTGFNNLKHITLTLKKGKKIKFKAGN